MWSDISLLRAEITVHENIPKLLSSEAAINEQKRQPANINSMDSLPYNIFLTYPQAERWLRETADKFPELAQLKHLAKTEQGESKVIARKSTKIKCTGRLSAFLVRIQVSQSKNAPSQIVI